MNDSSQLNELVQRLLASLPPGLKELPKDIEEHFKITLQDAFRKMNLVTREEFDIQTKVLAKTRQKLDRLEEQLMKFEEDQ